MVGKLLCARSEGRMADTWSTVSKEIEYEWQARRILDGKRKRCMKEE